MVFREVAAPWLGWVSFIVAVLDGITIWIAPTFSNFAAASRPDHICAMRTRRRLLSPYR